MVGQIEAKGEAIEGDGGLWRRLRGGLAKTRGQLAQGVGTLLLGKKEIDDAALEELETALLSTDVGVEATQAIMESLAGRVRRKQLNDTQALYTALRSELTALLKPITGQLCVDTDAHPFVILFVGVNGVGKTTTIGKLARRFKIDGHQVMLAAGDTFRAAAVEQLVAWGDANDVPVIAQQQGADSASVVFDAVQSGAARGADVVLADTAGRLQAKTHLMDELRKIKRVVGRLDEAAPHEVLLVLDAGVGQNALSQVAEFDAAVGLTGLVITKLDGSARAGILFAIARQFEIPVYFVGVGEQLEDLQPFDADDFVAALLDQAPDANAGVG
jgi:fused signal recognition particle receptor